MNKYFKKAIIYTEDELHIVVSEDGNVRVFQYDPESGKWVKVFMSVELLELLIKYYRELRGDKSGQF